MTGLLEVLNKYMPEFKSFRATYSEDDSMHIVEPTADGEGNNSVFDYIINNIDKNYRIIILDEHGKLKISYTQEPSGDFFSVYDYKVYDHIADKTKMLECGSKDEPFYLIEDYKLKKLIDRLTATLRMYGAVPIKEERGSLHNNHLLWMLEEIYSQRKPLTKRYNWLGFVQCALVSKNIIDIKHERDIMHEIF